MRVCVLTDEEPEDFDPAPFLRDHQWNMVTMRAPVFDTIKAIADEQDVDVYLNICEGWEEGSTDPRAYAGIDVIRALERLQLPYTGANEAGFDPAREHMQAVAETNAIGFPKGYHVTGVAQGERLAAMLRFPLMVKHPRGYGSTGVTRGSRVDTPEDLAPRLERVCAEFGAARMEEFIVGREFNALVVDNADDRSRPFVYPPAELLFPVGEDFWHAEIKWTDGVAFAFTPVAEPELVLRLQDVASRMFLAIDAVGYARCDLRMDSTGNLWVLEINPNPAIMYTPEEHGPADFMILSDPAEYRGFFDRIFRHASMRQKTGAR